MSRESHNGTYLILGAFIGVILGLLYAPKTGKETRDIIKNATDNHQDFIDTTKESAEELVSKTKSQVEDLITNLSKAIDEKLAEKDITEEESTTETTA
jgi:gas vesicle protein